MEPSNAWAFPAHMQPQSAEVSFDLEAALDSVLRVHAEIPADAFTANILGTERVGSGVVIGEDGLILTIGYLVTEAESVWLTSNDGSVYPGHPLAYDFATGFGLVFPLGKLRCPVLSRGSARDLRTGADVIAIGHGGQPHALRTRLQDKREFAGYWEYVLDEALFTAPAHPEWGGAALLSEEGLLVGIGSLLVEEKLENETAAGNMFVPIDLLEPILDDLRLHGRARAPVRPWLGMYTAETEGGLVVTSVAPGGPAERAGIRHGDAVSLVAGQRPQSLADLFRRIWRLGAAGTVIPLDMVREGKAFAVRVVSGDRSEFLRKPRMH